MERPVDTTGPDQRPAPLGGGDPKIAKLLKEFEEEEARNPVRDLLAAITGRAVPAV